MRLRTAIAATFIAGMAVAGLSAPAFASTTSTGHTRTEAPVNQDNDHAKCEVLPWFHFPQGNQWNWGEWNRCPVPPVRHCTTQLVVFNFPHWSHVLTETFGPWLHVGEVAFYNSNTYTITGVWHQGAVGHDRFTISDSSHHPVTNWGPSIWHGDAWALTCTTW